MWTDERTPRVGRYAANTRGMWPRWFGTTSRANRSAGRPSIIGRTSSIVSSRLTLVAIWKSAALRSERDADLRPLQVGLDRGAVALEGIQYEPARDRLEHLLAPGLGLLHLPAPIRISREQRW